MPHCEARFEHELVAVLETASNPIQGILALFRLHKHSQHSCCSDDACPFIRGIISKNNGLLAKISLFISNACRTEKMSIDAEFPSWLRLELSRHQNSDKPRRHLLNEKHISSGKQGQSVEEDRDVHSRKRSRMDGTVEDSPDQSKNTSFLMRQGKHGIEERKSKNAAIHSLDVEYENKERNQRRVSSRSPDGNSGLRFVDHKPYSKSSLWAVQQNYYRERGARAWEQGEVPSMISSNPFVADMYVRMIMGMALSYHKELAKGNGLSRNGEVKINSSHPSAEDIHTRMKDEVNKSSYSNKLRIAVVEIGAGHGLLSLLMARKFREIASTSSSLMRQNCSDQTLESKEDLTDCCCRCMKRNVNKNSSKNNHCNCTCENDGKKEKGIHSGEFASSCDVTVIATDFHSAVFEDLLQHPWVRYNTKQHHTILYYISISCSYCCLLYDATLHCTAL